MRREEKEVKDKRIFRLYRRQKEIKRELTKKYPVHFSFFPHWYTFKGPFDNIDYFLELRGEALRIYNILYKEEHRRYIKYVKGGNTYFYTPMKKKERRKALRKFRLLPIGYYQKVYEDDYDLL